MSGEEWRGGSRYSSSSHGGGSGGRNQWSWWMVGTSSGGARRGWGKEREKEKEKEDEKESEKENENEKEKEREREKGREKGKEKGSPHVGMSTRRTAGVWSAFLIAMLSLMMIINNAKLIRDHVHSAGEVLDASGKGRERVERVDLRRDVKVWDVKVLPEVDRTVVEPHPCEGFRIPPPPKDPKRTGPRPCPVCYLPENLAISQIPAAGKYMSPVVKRLRYVSDEQAARRPSGSAPGSAFGGYPSLKERERSFQVREDMLVHCGFVTGPTPGMGTGYDFDEDDRNAMHACQGVVVASAIFGNYDQLQQPKNISEEARKSVCFFMFVDVETEAYLDDYDVNFKTTKQVGIWRVVVVRNLPYRDPRRTGKIPKLLLHRLFPFVRFSIWADGKLELVEDPYRILERFLWRTNETFAISQHYKRFDVFEEAEANKAAGKYSNKSIDWQVAFYKAEGLTPYSSAKLPITSDVPEGCVIIREHTPMANLMSCLWFNEVDRFTSRDQLSFGIVRDKLMASVSQFRVSMFLDCERRNFVVQGYHRDLLVKRGILPISNSSSVEEAKEVRSGALGSSKPKNQVSSKTGIRGTRRRKLVGKSRLAARH